MRTKLFTLRFSESLGGFDDTPLLEFTRDKEQIAFREYFFSVNEVPHLACIVTYQEPVMPPEALQAARDIAQEPPARRGERRRQSSSNADAAAGLNERDRALFNSLREWR